MTPGTYPSALKVRLGPNAGFFFADEDSADLTILTREPAVTWTTPASITYGTPLEATQLNATADVPGAFVYSPQAGVVLPAGENQALTVTFIPDDSDQYDQVTSTVFLDVQRAPLSISVTSVSKLYLDSVPVFSVTSSGFVNGDTAAVLSGSPVFQTTATAASPVGTYPVTATGLSSPNYVLTYHAGVLTIAPRPTSTVLGAGSPSPAVYGQAVTIAAAVSSTVGQPTGSVTLFDGGNPIGSAALINGTATFFANLNAGTHALTAAFNGGNGFLASSSTSSQVVVSQAGTTTQLTSSLNPSRTGQGVDFSATVKSSPTRWSGVHGIRGVRAGRHPRCDSVAHERRRDLEHDRPDCGQAPRQRSISRHGQPFSERVRSVAAERQGREVGRTRPRYPHDALRGGHTFFIASPHGCHSAIVEGIK